MSDALREMTFDGSWSGWRAAARRALSAAIAPSRVVWRAGADAQGSLLHAALPSDSIVPDAELAVPRAFLTLGADVACFRRAPPWDALYRVLWRLTHGERALLDVYVDEDVHALERMAKTVRREGHKLRAFVRFRLVHADDGSPRYVAWFEPMHDVLPREAPFFARRFPSMRWSILTPDRSAHWDGAELTLAGGVPRAEAPAGDALEELWRTYYAHTFNPARVKPKMMRSEMPVRYWQHLPEASLIAPLLRDAPGRVRAMVDRQVSLAAPPVFPVLPRRGAPPERQSVPRSAPAHHQNVARATVPAHDPAGPHDPGVEHANARSHRARAITGHRDASAAVGGIQVRVGTASWTDPTMTAAGVFYPDDVRDARSRLEFYASRFSLVEVDATYYAMPSERVVTLWAERSPAGFVFDVKAHALMTGHATQVARLPTELRDALPARLRGAATVRSSELPAEYLDEVWRRFLSAIAPLRRAGKLGALLLQLPRWCDASARHERAIARLRARAGDALCAVELRHASWLAGEARTARTLDLLRAHDHTYVMVDAPPGFDTSMPSVTAVTSDRLAMVRLHGRRRETWEAPVAVVSERYRYLYDATELREWVPRIIDVAQRTQGVHVVMNNCHANYGTTNADEITALLVEFDRERHLLRDPCAVGAASGD